MKKCLVFGLSSQWAGVEAFIFNYIKNMEKIDNTIRYEFVLFDKVPDYFEDSFLKNHEVHIVPTRLRRPIAYYNKLKKIVRQGQFDIIWYNACTLSDITLLKIAKKYRVPCRIVHSHNSENMGGKFVQCLHTIHKKAIGRIATDFFACSKEAGEFMFSERICKKDMQIVKNAICVEKYVFNSEIRQTKRRSLGIQEELLIGHVGRFHFQKNHDFIIKVFNHVLLMHENSKLLLIGEGELKEKIINESKKLGIFDKIIFLEKRKDVNELIQAMDVFLFPSRFEGLGIALIEAEASDLPCIISDKIPDEAKLTKKIRSFSLQESPKVWADAILEESKNSTRKSQEKVFKEKGYDISYNAKIMVNSFNKMIERGKQENKACFSVKENHL